jgi:deoxyribonuclease (pyrimidine dimer)
MTRINCIPVQELTDQHLLIEYREITRVSSLARELKPAELVPEYRLGAGHVKFFYDKGQYLSLRCEELYQECKRRGFNVTHKVYYEHPSTLNQDWEPMEADRTVNRRRLQEKIMMRRGFYKYYSESLLPSEESKFYIYGAKE